MSTQTCEVSKTDQATDRRPQAEYRPAVDILATDKTFEMTVELPGVSEDNVDVTIDKNILTICGCVDVPEFEGMIPIHREYGIGNYRRSFTLAEDIDPDSVEAEIHNGLLKLTLSRRQPVGPTKVAIKSA